MTYASEFPGFPVSGIPACVQVEGWTDASWRNDMCPFFIHEETGLGVWCDYLDAGERECPDTSKRFVVVQLTRDSEKRWVHWEDPIVFECDDPAFLVDLIDEIESGEPIDTAARSARGRSLTLTVKDARILLAENAAAALPCPDERKYLQSIIAGREPS